MKPYESYKDSGVPSIGIVPAKWAIVPIKYVLDQSSDGIKIGPFGSTLTGKVSPDYSVKVYGQWNVIGKDFSAGKNYVSEETYHELESYWIHSNDILISMMGTVGKCAIIPLGVPKGIMDSHIVKIRLNETVIDPQYFFYVYDKDGSSVIMSQIQRERRGSIMDGLNSTLIKNFSIPLPSLPEQRIIASYLDYRVSQIDETIKEEEQMLEDLKAYRSSIISEAVTKGLNPDVPMKDSGIEWIGMIPEHWRVSKLKTFADVQTGSTPSTAVENYWSRPTEEWYTPSDFDDNDIILKSSSRKLSKVAFEDEACRVFDANTVLIVGIGATLGKVGITLKVCSANQQINAVSFNSEVIPLYGAYYLYSIKEGMKAGANAATLAILNQSATKDLPFVCPPYAEQKMITKKISRKLSLITGNILNLQSQIEDLKAYKSSLITEAVTGKIDLRGWNK